MINLIKPYLLVSFFQLYISDKSDSNFYNVVKQNYKIYLWRIKMANNYY